MAISYLFNCVAHKCNAGDYDLSDPKTHTYLVASPVLCNISNSYCFDAVGYGMGCNSTIMQGGCTNTVGEEKAYNLPGMLPGAGTNDITQYRVSADTIINGTSAGHRYEDGMVVRWRAVDNVGDVRIWTYGIGTNRTEYLKTENKYLGELLFIGVGDVNKVNVQIQLWKNK
jgi:hypothetical protein